MRRVCATLLACVAFAQQPATDTVKFQTSTLLVVEMVSVKDKSGKTVEGLTAKDFTITEDGKPQTIQFCEFQRLQDTPVAAPPAAPQNAVAAAPVVGIQPVTKNQIMPEKPGDIRYRDRRLIAMYFDMTAMPPPDQLRALVAARKFIATQMTAPDLVAIMSFSGAAVQVLQDFTADRDQLNKVIDTLIIGEGQDDATDDDESTADTGAAFGQNSGEFNIFNTDRQLAALQTAVKMLGTLNEN